MQILTINLDGSDPVVTEMPEVEPPNPPPGRSYYIQQALEASEDKLAVIGTGLDSLTEEEKIPNTIAINRNLVLSNFPTSNP